MKQYSLKTGVIKSLTTLALFAVPFFITSFPETANLTIGAVLTLTLNFLKVRFLTK